MSFPQVSENQNCATIVPFDRQEKQKKKYVTLYAKEIMGEFVKKTM